MTWMLLAVALGCVTTALAVVVVWQLVARARLRRRFAGVLDIDAEIASRRIAFERQLAGQLADVDAARQRATLELADTTRTMRELRAHHATSKASYDRLRSELATLQRVSDDFSVGLYTPCFALDTSADYRRRLLEARDQQKAAIREDRAVRCNPSWMLGDSRRIGARIQHSYARALLRAFNGECDAAISRIAWNNVTRTIERVKLAFEAINKLGSELQVEITARYRDLKLDELRLEYELAQKRHDEQEEQRAARAVLDEELRAQHEHDELRRDAESDQDLAQGTLDRARDELAMVRGVDLDDHLGAIAELEDGLRAAQQRAARAAEHSQQTRAGYVYVLSNIGSFGDTVYKIGMTRRLDPMAHVRELAGDALPFDFDIHAMIYTDDAPALEAKLHQELYDRRLNLVNPHRAFFHATLEEIEAFVISQGLEVQVMRTAEAQQYRESIARRRELAASARPAACDATPVAVTRPSEEVEPRPGRSVPALAPAISASMEPRRHSAALPVGAPQPSNLLQRWISERSRIGQTPFPEETPVG